ncbi:2'-5' RNA ligase family protein [Clostridium sp. FP1]|uniref:2'-5' RNA ligase family protein n=1 Tax=Clostridium sp. FP1 TaxID=2724076 RepID=UPI0013E94787|nr:2'-5' RNA ligase family protein [Clostridium sp. FP1]MBZ9635168.1 2'-5' RNA ligase family protein [Clostridium sp. FP1]
MLYAVELYFDKKTEEKIMRLPNGIAKKGISKRYLEWKTRPHITLGLFNNIDFENCDKLLDKLTKQISSFPTHLSSIGVFNNSKCIFLSPVVTRELFELHREFHNTFSFCDHSGYEYYLPDSWVPHCAVMLGDSDDANALCASVKYVIENYEVIHGFFCEISFVEIIMPVKEHVAHKLKPYDGISIYKSPQNFSINPDLNLK